MLKKNTPGLGNKVVFIDGYQGFIYPKKALICEVRDYILKFMEKNEQGTIIRQTAFQPLF